MGWEQYSRSSALLPPISVIAGQVLSRREVPRLPRHDHRPSLHALQCELRRPNPTRVRHAEQERVGRLEVNVEHIQEDVSEIKIDLRRLSDKIDTVDQKLTDKIEGVDQRLTAKIDSVDQLIMSSAILGIMARAFKMDLTCWLTFL
jgi:hypothetical protein